MAPSANAQQEREKIANLRKGKPCVRCGQPSHAYIQKNKTCTKPEKNLSDQERIAWAQNELNPANEAAAIQARLSSATSKAPAASPSQATTIPILASQEPQVPPRRIERGPPPPLYDDERPMDGTYRMPHAPVLPPSALNPDNTSSAVAKDNRSLWHQETSAAQVDNMIGQTSYVKAFRTGFATVGASYGVLANFFRVNLPRDVVMHKYSLNLPTSMNRAKKRRIIEQLTPAINGLGNGSGKWATDYSSIVVAWEDLFVHEDGSPGVLGEVREALTGYQYKTPTGKIVDVGTLTLTYTEPLHLNDLRTFVQGNNRGYNSAPIVQALNIVIAMYGNTTGATDLVTMGSNKFMYKHGYCYLDTQSYSGMKPSGLVGLRGYFTSIRPAMSSVLLNVNTVMSPFYRPTYLPRFIQEFFSHGNRGQEIEQQQLRQLKRILHGVKVRICYDRKSATTPNINYEENRIKNICGVGETPYQQTFDMTENGKTRTTNVADYLVKHVAVIQRINFPNLPCINLGSPDAGKENWVPAELLWILPYQPYRGKLPETATRAMVDSACRSPLQNAGIVLQEALPNLGITPPSAPLTSLGLQIDNKLLRIPARLLRVPGLVYGRGSKNAVTPTNGSWDLKELEFYKTSQLDVLNVLIISPRGGHNQINPQAVMAKLGQLQSSHLRVYGFNTSSLDFFDFKLPHKDITRPIQVYEANVMDLIAAGITRFKNQSKVVLIIIPSNDTGLYSLIKRVGDMKLGVATVCSIWSKVDKNRRVDSLLGNLALKINMKLGGTNHTLEHKNLEALYKGDVINTMIVGADVTHPAAHSIQGCPSIAAVTASIDGTFGQYPGTVRLQESRQEMIAELKEMLTQCLHRWQTHNRRLPENILFYRDGVSDTQFDAVRSVELPHIEAACAAISSKVPGDRNPFGKAPYKPKLTFVVVSKRHHTRFYPQSNDRSDKDANDNCKPGTVIDSEVVSPFDFDFYLQAHAAIKGSARTALYTVLTNGMEFTPDSLQSLTMDICYTYARATKGISYATPARYADRLCDRGRVYLHELFSGVSDLSVNAQPEGTYKARMLAHVKATMPEWNLALGSSGPWHRGLDNVMFYL